MTKLDPWEAFCKGRIIRMAKETMRAVVFKGPHTVVLEDRPIPKIKEGTDIIVKVKYTALCGR